MVLVKVKMRANIRVWIVFSIFVFLTHSSHSLPQTRSSVLERRLDTLEKNVKSLNNALSKLVYAVSIVALPTNIKLIVKTYLETNAI